MTLARRIAAATALSTALVGAFGAGWILSAEPEPPAVIVAASHPFAAATDLTPAADCDTLLEDFQARGRDIVGAWGWEVWGGSPVFSDATAGAASSESSDARSVRATSNAQGTNVQEEGVDEPDVVKVDGDLLVRLSDDGLETWDMAGQEPRLLGSAQTPSLAAFSPSATPEELLLVGETAVVFAEPLSGDQPQALVTTVDLSDPSAPAVTEEAEIEGDIDAVRLVDGVVHMVLTQPLPDLDFVFPDGDRSERAATRANRDLVERTELSDWLPSVDGTPVVDCARMAVPTDDARLGATVVTSFEPGASEVLQAPPIRTAAGVAVGVDTTYVSGDRIHLASTEPGPDGWLSCWNGCASDTGRTRLDSFAIDATDTTWLASGYVDGVVRDRWAMDSADGSLRVALGPSRATGNFNSVVTLAEDDGVLSEIGRVDHLGEDEEIKSVRWFDDLAILVTFRQTDPLYAVDLTDAAAPALLSELKIPGFSEYLHPLGSERLIGMGQDANPQTGQTSGAQAALFDVSDLAQVRRLDVVTYEPETAAQAALDPRQFTWLPEHRTALTVVTKGWNGRTGWVSVLSLADGAMRNRMVEVDHGDDVERIRTVPLADGRVALVTSGDVEFFAI